MKNEEIIQKFAFEEYPENISYSTVIEKMIDYNWRYRKDFIKGAEKMAKWKDKKFDAVLLCVKNSFEKQNIKGADEFIAEMKKHWEM